MNLKQTLIKLKWIPSNQSGSHFNIPCILHNEAVGKSLFINTEANFYKCYGKCQVQGKLTDLLLKEGMIDLSSLMIQPLEKKEVIEEEIIEKGLDYIWKYNINIKDIDYLNKRGLDYDIYSKNYIYFSEWDQRVHIPFFCDGKYYGDVSRTILNLNDFLKEAYNIFFYLNKPFDELSQEELKQLSFNIEINTEYDNEDWLSIYVYKYKIFTRYKNDKNLPKKYLVYEPLTNNEVENKDYLFLVESQLDAIKINQFGYQALAILGGGFKEMGQINLIKKKAKGKQLVCAFDNDLAGEKFYNSFCQLSMSFPYRFDWKRVGRKLKDIGDISKEEFELLIKTKKIL